jgi:hypothetical protein
MNELAAAVAAYGLLLRGGFVPDGSDALPQLPNGNTPRWLAMVGAAGSQLWPTFTASVFYRDGQAHALDRWSAAVGHELARRFGGVALFPFGGPPHHPFQRWAERAEGLHASPLGLRLHPRYGLWHSFRFALALPHAPHEDEPAPAAATDLCASCTAQPCLHACPVDAFTGRDYRVDVCASHLASQPEPACRGVGCLARHACPHGQAFAQQPAHARFLMDAFVAARPSR